MHIKPHAGALFAFNGYWEDQHYPSEQSAQVLRLDKAGGKWEVDLDTGAAGRPTHMKGNILHVARFTTDSRGRKIDRTLLVAASQADPVPSKNLSNALSVFVRSDTDGSWSCTTLLQGYGSGPTVRKVPRAITVYRDTVTNIDRIFMLAGQPGVISGVYDEANGGVAWDSALEFPSNGSSFSTRPLGLAVANGKLYFDVGGEIYVRKNGENPSWSLAYTIPGKVNIEVGGIRGLSSIPNPAGAGDSLIFVWTPAGKAPGEIIRLDGPALVQHTETSLRALYDSHALPSGGNSTGSLGGYNLIFPLEDPATGRTVHLVGFEQSVRAADPAVTWYNYYAGGCYAVRASPTEYSTHEVNGRFEHGKPVLEAARAFSMSPFPGEEHVVYFGGFDANFHPATNMAWIFKAGVDTVLGRAG